jgi:hypothetical protein
MKPHANSARAMVMPIPYGRLSRLIISTMACG